MGANDRKISVTLDVGAEISKFNGSIKSIQDSLNKLQIPNQVEESVGNLFDEYNSEIKKVEKLLEQEGGKLTPVNEKEVLKSKEKIEKIYKELFKQINSDSVQTSFLKADEKALTILKKLEEQFKNQVEETNKAIKKQEIELERVRKKESDKLTNLNVATEAQKKATQELEKFDKEHEDVLKHIKQEKEAIEEQSKAEKNLWKKDGKKVSTFTESPELIARRVANQERENELLEERSKYINAESAAKKVATSVEKEYEAAKIKTAGAEANYKKALDEQNNALEDIKNKLQDSVLKSGIDWDSYGVDPKTITSVDSLSSAIEQIKQKAGPKAASVIMNLSKAMEEAGLNSDTFQKAIKDAGISLDDLKERQADIERMRNSIVRFFSIANTVRLFRRAVRSAIETVKDLDKVMTETAVVTNFSVSDMWKQLPEYTERANKLGVTIHDVYESATLYYQQGLKTNEVMAVSNATLKMARIASLDAAEATDRMTNALRGFNMEINEVNADRVADVYSKLAAMSASNVDEISTAMTKVASLAHSANMQFETTSAFLAQIIETTRESAETAGTALKTVIARFSEVKKLFSEGELLGTDEEGEAIDVNKISKALREVAGINLNEYLTGMKGLDEIFLDLASKWDSLTTVEQRYIATTAAGSRQQSRFIAMMQDYKRTMELTTAASNAAGASQEQYEKTLESLESKLNKLKNTWNTFLMDIADNQIIKTMVDTLNSLITGVNKISNLLPQPISLFGKLFGMLAVGKGVRNIVTKEGGLLDAVSQFLVGKKGTEKDFKKTFSNVTAWLDLVRTNGVNKVKESLGDLSTAFKGDFNKVLGSTKIKIEAFGSQLKNLLPIIGKITLGVGAAVLVFITLKETFEGIKALSLEGKIENLNKALQEAQDHAQETNTAFTEFNNNIDKLEDGVVTLNSLTVGTNQWREQLTQVNDEVLKLINTYPDLAKFLTLGKNGELTISPEGIEQKERELKETRDRANLQTIGLQISRQNVQKNQIESEIRKYLPAWSDKTFSQIKDSLINNTQTYFNGEMPEGYQKVLKLIDEFESLDNASYSLYQAFTNAAKELNGWTEEETPEIGPVVKNAIEKRATTQANSFNGQYYEYQLALANFLSEQGYKDARMTFLGDYKYTDVEGNTQTISKQVVGEMYDAANAREKELELITQYKEAIENISEENSWVLDVLNNPEGIVQNDKYTENIFKEVLNNSGLVELLNLNLEELWKRYSENNYSKDKIKNTQTNIIGTAISKYNKEAKVTSGSEMYDLLEGTNLSPEKINEIIKYAFSGNINLSDVDAIRGITNSLEELGLDSDQATKFINKLIELADASAQIDSDKFASMTEFVDNMKKTDIFTKENIEELSKTYGISSSQFAQIGNNKYALKIEEDKTAEQVKQEFGRALEEAITRTLQDSYNTAVKLNTDSAWADYYKEQATAGYYGYNTVSSNRSEEYYSSAKSSFMNSEAGKNYNLQLGEKNLIRDNKELADSLYSSANAASKLLPKLKELTDVIKDNAEALEEDDVKAIAEVTKAFNEAFGTNLTEEFVQKNKPALIDFANGVEGAYDQVSDAILQSFIESGDEGLNKYVDVFNQIQGLDWDINGQANLDVGPLIAAIGTSEEKAEELRKELLKAGIAMNVTWEEEEASIFTGQFQPWGEPIYQKVKRLKASNVTLTNAFGQQETINAGGGGSKKSSGGGSSSKPKYWDNPYDELYNLLEKQNEALRTREKLEREYDRILKDRSRSAKELLQNSLDEITNLRKELGIQEQIQAGRVRMINELGSKGHRDSEGNLRSFDEWGASNYAHYDFERNVVVIDWAAIDRINDPDKGGAIEAYISKLEELSSSFEETQDKIEEMKDLIQEIRERGMKEYIDYEKRALDAIIAREQKVIDEYSALSDTINESNSNILSSLRESIDLERQIRDNTKTEQDIADKEARLAYLQRDTSGANQQEILKLQKELDQARESYGDTLVDQSIENLETENEKAQEQRQQQIDIMQAQLNWMEETGGFWEEVYSLFEGSFDENGKVIEDSKLMNLIRQAEGYRGMSKFGKQNFDNDLIVDTNQAYLGYTNWTGQGQGDDSAIIEETPVSENPYPSASGNLGGLNRYINFGDRSDAVRQLQAGLNDLVRDQMLGGEIIDEDGSYGPATKQKVALLQSTLNEYFGSGLRVDGYWGPRTYEALMNTHLNQYKTGGLVTSTGPAWLDGTKSSPEMVLSARDTENFIALRNALTQMVAQGGGKSGDNYFDIQINVDELGSDYDVDQLADKVKRQIVQDSMYRNVNAINYLR